MTCQEFVELVTDYLEGALDPSERARFAAHIDHCDGCEEYLVQFRETIAAVGISRRSRSIRPPPRSSRRCSATGSARGSAPWLVDGLATMAALPEAP